MAGDRSQTTAEMTHDQAARRARMMAYAAIGAMDDRDYYSASRYLADAAECARRAEETYAP